MRARLPPSTVTVLVEVVGGPSRGGGLMSLARVRTGVHVGKERGVSPLVGALLVGSAGVCVMGGATGRGWAGGGAAKTLVVVVVCMPPRANRDWPLCGVVDDVFLGVLAVCVNMYTHAQHAHPNIVPCEPAATQGTPTPGIRCPP